MGVVSERGDALVSELKDMFGVSEVTVRADLAALADRGLIVRTHGGAVLPEPGSKAPEPTFAAREMANVELKRRIGEAAAALIQNGQSVVLDASTTALQIARVMRRRESVHDVNVITNGVHTGADLLSRVHATLGFFGARGLTTSQGLTDINLQEVEMKAAMADVCERVVAVLDHTKLGQVGLATFVACANLALVITDDGADPTIVAELERAGVEVQLV